jgi:flagellin FlaB
MSKWMGSLRRFLRNKRAISGLETAIVLIAFVIVASAFAYAVLNMGFLATQKSQQAVLGGLAGTSAALALDGPVYGYSNSPGTNGNLTSIIFWLQTAPGAGSVDLSVNQTMISFQNPRGLWLNVYNTGGGDLGYITNGIEYEVTASAASIVWEIGSGMQLTPGQKVRVTIDLTQLSMLSPNPTGGSGCINEAEGCRYAGEVMRDEEFTVIVKPPVGSVIDIDRVAPGAVSQVNDLG